MENSTYLISAGNGDAGQGRTIPINDIISHLNWMIEDEILQPITIRVFHH